MKRRRFKTTKSHRDRLKDNNRRWRKSPHGAYVTQRINAKRRCIAWAFTFESWWQLWSESGHFAYRGRRRGFYCMARLGDVGPYSPENCRIVEFGVNCQAAIVTAKIMPASRFPHLADLYNDCPF